MIQEFVCQWNRLEGLLGGSETAARRHKLSFQPLRHASLVLVLGGRKRLSVRNANKYTLSCGQRESRSARHTLVLPKAVGRGQ